MVLAEAGLWVQIEAAVAAGLLQAGSPVTGSQATPLTTLVCQTQYLGAGIFQAAFPVRWCSCKPHIALRQKLRGWVHGVCMWSSHLQGTGVESEAMVPGEFQESQH